VLPPGVLRDRLASVRDGVGAAGRHPNVIARLGLLLGLGVGAVLLIPLLIVGFVAMLVFLAALKVRVWLTGARAPNGALDGRRNVRVVRREE